MIDVVAVTVPRHGDLPQADGHSRPRRARQPPEAWRLLGLALEQLIRASGASDEEAFFWGVHNQAELDLLVFRGGQRLSYEVKYTDRPRLSKSQHLALEHLRLDRLTVVIPGAADYPLGDRIHVRGLDTLIGGADPGQRLR